MTGPDQLLSERKVVRDPIRMPLPAIQIDGDRFNAGYRNRWPGNKVRPRWAACEEPPVNLYLGLQMPLAIAQPDEVAGMASYDNLVQLAAFASNGLPEPFDEHGFKFAFQRLVERYLTDGRDAAQVVPRPENFADDPACGIPRDLALAEGRCMGSDASWATVLFGVRVAGALPHMCQSECKDILQFIGPGS